MPNPPPKHSAVPWKVRKVRHLVDKEIVTAGVVDMGDAVLPPLPMRVATRIVQAANAFEGLVGALDELLKMHARRHIAVPVGTHDEREVILYEDRTGAMQRARLALAATERKG